MWAVIGTWEMVEKGVSIAGDMLAEKGHVFDAIEACVKDVEKNENFTSVGLGGLPNAEGQVELDAAFMDGKTLSVGALAGIKDFLHPVSIARTLMKGPFNNFLVGQGAEKYALEKGFERYPMLTDKAKAVYEERVKEVQEGLSPYIGHDTVCVVGLDTNKNMATATSTSGLFYKRPGRVGDSPIIGSGYYVDETIGGAAATGLGEDIMKGCISYDIVMKMQTMSPQEACQQAVKALDKKLTRLRGKAGDISVVAMNASGDYGAATNIDNFPFVVMTEDQGLQVLSVNKEGEITCLK